MFNKEHLRRDDYEWDENTFTVLSHDPYPTRRKFNRFNGDSVLHIINIFDRLVTGLSLTQAQNLELLIARELPLTLSSEVSVFNWLKERFVLTNPECRLN